VSARDGRVGNAVAYVVLSLVAVTTLVPFLWTVSTSLKPEGSVFDPRPTFVPRLTYHEAIYGGKRVRVRPLATPEHPDRVKLLGAPPGENGASSGEASSETKRLEPGESARIVDAADVTTVTTLDVHFENYPEAWRAYPFVSFWRAYANSLAVAALVTIGQVLTSTLAAYAFARLRFPGRDVLFFGYLATMMIPGAVTMIPTFALLKNMPVFLNYVFHTSYFSRDFILGGRLIGIDSYFALIAPRCFSAYGVFMLRQFFLGIPKELEEAARIDGCGSLGVLRHVVVPLAKPALVTLAIFTFMWAWGDFLWPLIVTDSDEIKTLPLLLQSFQGQHATRWNYLMAASVTALAPMVVAFLLGQRSFIEGIKLGAVKG
jgi:multiple sugar transport system permease protein